MRVLLILQLALVALASSTGWPEADSQLQSDARLQLLLSEGVLMRCFPAAIDTVHGGYRFVDALPETDAGGLRKTLMGQAGAVWFLSRMVASGQASSEYLPVAQHGFSFLARKMWDRVFGGFFWEMDQTGRIGTKPHKQMLGQATALLALAEYAAVSQDTMAAQLARRLYDRLDERAWDATHGGYREWFRRDWEAAAPEQAYVIAPAGGKLLGTQLRMAEALQAYLRLDSRSQVLDRLRTLVLLLTAAAGDPAGTAPGRGGDWALPDSSGGRPGSALDFELCWHLAPLWRAAGWPVSMARQVQARRYAIVSAQQSCSRVDAVDAAASMVASASPEQLMVAALAHHAHSGRADSRETFSALLEGVSMRLSSRAALRAAGVAPGAADVALGATGAAGVALGSTGAGSRGCLRTPGPFTIGRALVFAREFVREMRSMDGGAPE